MQSSFGLPPRSDAARTVLGTADARFSALAPVRSALVSLAAAVSPDEKSRCFYCRVLLAIPSAVVLVWHRGLEP
jgi:hypothetical protein